MSMENKEFKSTTISYYVLVHSYSSLSILKKQDKFICRIRLMFRKEFFKHAIGLQWSKNNYKKLSDLEFVLKIANDEIKLSDIVNNCDKNSKKMIIKKIKALSLFIKIIQNNHTLALNKNNIYFRIRQANEKHQTYEQSDLIIATKPDKSNKCLVIYAKKGNLYNFNIDEINNSFYNSDHSAINSVFWPISLKYSDFSKLPKGYWINSDCLFLNKVN